MQATGRITPGNLMGLEAYSRWRTEHRGALIALRRLRTVPLGEHLLLQFESELTLRYQIQEMLRIEKIFEETAIREEIAAYAPLLPDGVHWTATLMLAYPDAAQRREALARLVGVEDHIRLEVPGHAPVTAVADEDRARGQPEKTAAVHFLRFPLTPALRAAVLAGGAVHLACSHPHYRACAPIPADTLAALAQDLRNQDLRGI